MEATRVQLCGRITVSLEGRQLEAGLPRGQGRLLFVYLVLNRMRPLSRDQVAAAIWSEEAPAEAQADLRVLVSRLRRLLGANTIEGRSTLRLLLPDDAWVDTEVAARKIHEAEAAVHVHNWSKALPAASVASTIAERGFLPGSDVPWVVERRRWLEDLRMRALECDGVASLGIGVSEVAAAATIRAASYQPLQGARNGRPPERARRHKDNRNAGSVHPPEHISGVRTERGAVVRNQGSVVIGRDQHSRDGSRRPDQAGGWLGRGLAR